MKQVLRLDWGAPGPDGVGGGDATHLPCGRLVATLRPFELPGGHERAEADPRRSVLGLLRTLYGARGAWLGEALYEPALAPPSDGTRTTSMLRLVEAFAALAGLVGPGHRPGQALAALESVAEPSRRIYYLPLVRGHIETERAARVALLDRVSGLPPGEMAWRLYQGLAHTAVGLARRDGADEVVLAGCCLAEGLLSETVYIQLVEHGFDVRREE